MKQGLKTALCLAACLGLLTGCGTSSVTTDSWPTLPPAEDREIVPADDSGLVWTAEAELWLPSIDGTVLVCQREELSFSEKQLPAETVVRALLRHPGSLQARSLDTEVYLAGGTPVTVSGGICTVNLAPAALSLSKQELYTAGLSIATTLCALDGIDYVNILVSGQSVPMDVAGYLPMGLLTAHTGDDLTVLWDQMDGRRVPLGESASSHAVTSVAALYYPMTDGGTAAEPREVIASGQTPAQLARAVLEALSLGASRLEGSEVPDASCIEDVTSDDMPEGGRRLTVSLSEDLDDTLNMLGISRTDYLAALTLTLTGFVPQVTSVRFLIGGEPAEGMEDGVMTRSDALPRLCATWSICLAKGDSLVRVQRSAVGTGPVSLRKMLVSMGAGATAQEQENGVTGLLPSWLQSSDIIGLTLDGDTLVVNFAQTVADSFSASSTERLACYSIVQTLLDASQAKRVAFLFDGKAADTLAGDIWWGGTFMAVPSLVTDIPE